MTKYVPYTGDHIADDHYGWVAILIYGEYHIVPVDDGMLHEPEACLCGPETHLEQSDTGDRWFVLHASLDGRERHE
jgi:hypothetical protein